jgi:molecular chaperone HtpG
LNDIIDPSWMGQMESKLDGVTFVRVDSDIAENLVDKDENTDSVLSKDEAGKLEELFKAQVTAPSSNIVVKGLGTDAAPVVATRPEMMRRMKDMANLGGGGGMMGFYAQMPDEVNFTINGNHPVQQQILAEANVDKQQKQIKNLLDLALLSQGMLKGNDLTSFIARSVELMGNKN